MGRHPLPPPSPLDDSNSPHTASTPSLCHAPSAFARVVPSAPANFFATSGENNLHMYDQFVEKIPQIALQGYPAHQPMFVIPGGGMVPTTMAGPGAGHPAHLIGEALVFLVLSRLSNWLRASFYCQIRIQSFAEFYEVSFSPPWELMDLRNDHQSYSALLPYIHIFPSFSSASYMININIKQVSSMHAFSSVLLPFSTYFFFSFLQASSPPSIMQVCAISSFHLPHPPFFILSKV